MKRNTFHPTSPLTAITTCIAGICIATSMSLQASNIQVSRYSLLETTPTTAQSELLATTITIRFPERIQTVGGAVRYLLKRSGYRLVSVELINQDTQDLFALPLPVVHRILGPMMLRDALGILAGPAFTLVQDPVHRLITFERCTADWDAAQVSESNIDKEVTQNDD